VIRLLDNRLLVRPIYEQHGQFWTPEQQSRWGNGTKATRGTVVAVGPGMRMKNDAHRPIDVQIGDVVHFSDSCGRPFDDHLIIREDDIAFVEDEPIAYAEFIGAREDYDKAA